MARKIQIEIVGDSKSLERAFGRSGTAGASLDSHLSKLAKGGFKLLTVGALAAGAAVGVGFAAAVKHGMDEIQDSQRVAALTNAVLKSTGGIANVTAKQVDTLATSLSHLTGIDDEAVQAGENVLLSFTGIRNEVGKDNDIFNQATASAADLATKLAKGAVPSLDQMAAASKMLGKALNDPVKGTGLLSRAAIVFTDAEKKQIAELEKSGKHLEAQKIVLDKVRVAAGGAAKAAGDTLPGQLAKARNAFDEMSARVMVKFLPALTSALAWINDNWSGIETVFQTIADGIIAIATPLFGFFTRNWDKIKTAGEKAFNLTQAAAQALFDFLGSNKTLVLTVGAALAGLIITWEAITTAIEVATAAQAMFGAVMAVTMGPFVIAAGIVVALAAALFVLYQRSETVRAAIDLVGQTLMTAFRAAVEFVTGLWERFGGTITSVATNTFTQVATLVSTWARNLWAVVSWVVTGVQQLWSTFGGAIIFLAQTTWNVIRGVIEGTLRVIQGIINVFLGLLQGDWSRVWNGLKQIVSGVMQGIVAILNGIVSLILTAAKKVGQAIWNGITSLVGGVSGWIYDKLQDIGVVLGSIAGEALEWARGIGHSIVEGIKKGFEDLWEGVKNWIGEKVHGLSSFLGGLIGKGSPAILFANEVGMPIAQGIQLGIQMGMPGLLSTAKGAVMGPLVEMTNSIRENAPKLAQEFATMADQALAAFDAKMAAWTPPALKLLEKMDKEAADRNLAVLQKALEDAKAALESAKVDQAWNAVMLPGETVDEWVARTQAANQAVADAQKAADDAADAVRRANLTQRAEEQQAAHDEEVKKNRKKLQDQLMDLGAMYAEAKLTHNKAQKEIIKLLDSYGVKYRGSGNKLGDAFVDGILAQVDAAYAAGRLLAAAGAAGAAGGPNPNTTGKGTPRYAMGVRNAPGGWAIVGEHGPELINLPAGSDVIPITGSGGGVSGVGPGVVEAHFTIQLDGENVWRGVKRAAARDQSRNGLSWLK